MHPLWHTLKPLAIAALILWLVLTLARLAFTGLYWQRIANVDALPLVLGQGVRFDFVVIGMLLLIPCLLLPLFATSVWLLPVWKGLMSVFLPLAIMTVLFMELATPSFVDQFDARPNVLFFEYLEHPREVFATLWGAYRWPLVIGVAIVFLIGWGVFTLIQNSVQQMSPVSWWQAIPAGLILALLCGAAIRSTTDHRPVNPATVARTTDALVNELPMSSFYTVAYARYEMRHEESGGARYGDMDVDTATRILRADMHIQPDDFLDAAGLKGSILHHFAATAPRARPRNLVIILEESLGAEFVGSLGGLPLTPNLDALADEGLWFEWLYATGTRSVRGIEAVVSGFPPTPSRSVVKLSKSQREFFTLASFLGDQGYDTSFLYGGEGHFDNMRRFFMGNGFDRVVDQHDYTNPVFTGSWGVSDEDLLNRAHEEFSRLAAAGDQPFFSLVFSSSSHTPFEFPDDRIDRYDAEKQTVNNAVKYADYALGEFFRQARQSNYWEDTVFLVVADHNSRVYGDSLIPVHRFHIPAVILGTDIPQQHYPNIASQIDLAPTLLPLLGLSGTHPMPGRDVLALSADVPGRAIMQFNAIQAFMQNDDVVVLQRDLSPQEFHYRNNELTPVANLDAALVDKALAYNTWATDAYQNSRYHAHP